MFLNRSFIIISVIVTFAGKAYAHKWDTAYWERYPEKISVSLVQAIRGYDLSLNHKKLPDQPEENLAAYRSYIPITSGIRVNWEFIGITLSVKTPFIQDYSDKKSGYFMIGSDFGTNRYQGEVVFRKFNGFHDHSNANIFHPGDVFNDVSLNTELFRLRCTYNLNNSHYALRSGYNAKIRQKKSCGSPLIQASYYYNSFKSDSSLFPLQLVDSSAKDAPVDKMAIHGLSLGGGYSYTFVFKNDLFLSLMAIPCMDAQIRRYSTFDLEGKNTLHLSGSFSSRTQLGYNSKRLFSAISLVYELNTYNKQLLLFQSHYFSVEFKIGYRFNVPEIKALRRFR